MAVIAGAGMLMQAYGSHAQGKAAKKAADLNAADSIENARLAEERAKEDERQFRLSFKRDQGRNVAAIGASGVKQEGSPLEVLQDNIAGAERDAQNIRRGGEIQRDSYLRQARSFKAGGRAASQAAGIGTASSFLSGASDVYSTGQRSGAWG
jgi:hypothetical protein